MKTSGLSALDLLSAAGGRAVAGVLPSVLLAACVTSAGPASQAPSATRAPAVTEAPPAPLASSSAAPGAVPNGRRAQLRAEANLTRGLLEQGNYAELDWRMNGFQRAYEAHTLDEDGLLRAFAAFNVTDPALQVSLDAWVRAFPRSYAARLARGTYYFTSGTQTRGTKDVRHTTDAQWIGMAVYYGKARDDLRASLALDSKPLLTYNLLIRISMENGTRARSRSLLDAALKIDPTAMSVRRAYMRSLETRWGGNLDEMLAFMQETRSAGISDEQLSSLQRLIDEERGWLARYQGRK